MKLIIQGNKCIYFAITKFGLLVNSVRASHSSLYSCLSLSRLIVSVFSLLLIILLSSRLGLRISCRLGKTVELCSPMNHCITDSRVGGSNDKFGGHVFCCTGNKK